MAGLPCPAWAPRIFRGARNIFFGFLVEKNLVGRMLNEDLEKPRNFRKTKFY